MAGMALFIPTCSAQISPINPPSEWKVPNGSGACSVGKSCSELAPAMLQSALGASTIEENLRYLRETKRGRVTGSPKVERAIKWAVEAFRRAGVDEVHTEKFMTPNQVSGPAESENVVAEIRGREKPDEFVLLGTHLDSWGSGRGMPDDGSGAAMVIDAARVINSSGSVPRRSIRFVLFTGEKQGMPGSWAYTRAHRGELDRTSAVIFFDHGIGAVTGYSLEGRKDALAPVHEALAPLAAMGVKDFTPDAGIGTDGFDFVLEGILTLDPHEKPVNHTLRNHAASADTLEKADVAALKRQAGIAAITAYALADAIEPVARRQSRAEIEQLLKNTGLGEEMKIEGFWPAWKSGERGRKQ
jgi:Zn-dependent M28 family amino/carboxypeptidase